MHRVKEIISALQDAVQLVKGRQVIRGRELASLAECFGFSLKEIEILALKNGIWPVRYIKNFQTINCEQQIRLLQSEVVLCGLGGIGGFVLELLLRLGVGRIIAIDHDRFEESNLNRQLLADQDSMGQNKLDVAQQRASRVNPAVELVPVLGYQDLAGLQKILEGKRICIDAFGGIAEKQRLKEAALLEGVRVISGFVCGNLGFVTNYGPQQALPFPFWSGSIGAEEAMGCLPHVLSTVSGFICAEVLRLVCSTDVAMANKLFLIDFDQLSVQEFFSQG